jgi:hypothetical protein
MPEIEPLRNWIRRYGGPVLLVFAAIALVAFWFWNQGSEWRAIRKLPAEQQQELYQRTIQNLQHLCKEQGAGDLSSYCRQQAEFILQFPACDEACAALAKSQLPKGRR